MLARFRFAAALLCFRLISFTNAANLIFFSIDIVDIKGNCGFTACQITIKSFFLSAGNIAKLSFEDQYFLNGNNNGLTACRCLASFSITRWVLHHISRHFFCLVSDRVFAFGIAIFSFFFLLLKLTSIKLESREIL